MIEIKKKRELVKEIIETAIKGAIKEGTKLDKDIVWRITPEEYSDDILDMWLADEDGDQAIERLVTLIIY